VRCQESSAPGRLLEAAFKAWKKIRDGNRSPLRRAGRFGDIDAGIEADLNSLPGIDDLLRLASWTEVPRKTIAGGELFWKLLRVFVAVWIFAST